MGHRVAIQSCSISFHNTYNGDIFFLFEQQNVQNVTILHNSQLRSFGALKLDLSNKRVQFMHIVFLVHGHCHFSHLKGTATSCYLLYFIGNSNVVIIFIVHKYHNA